jgi:hypothetical protein
VIVKSWIAELRGTCPVRSGAGSVRPSELIGNNSTVVRISVTPIITKTSINFSFKTVLDTKYTSGFYYSINLNQILVFHSTMA